MSYGKRDDSRKSEKPGKESFKTDKEAYKTSKESYKTDPTKTTKSGGKDWQSSEYTKQSDNRARKDWQGDEQSRQKQQLDEEQSKFRSDKGPKTSR